MSRLSLFLGIYFLAAVVYWVSYILIRPHIHKTQKHLILFLSNMLLGIILVTALPIYLNLSGAVNNELILILAVTMGLSAILHHLTILQDVQRWRGIITPLGEKVPMVHGVVSHLLFAVSYLIYGFLLLYHYFGKTNLPIERTILFGFVFWIELVAIIVLYDGIRMCFKPFRPKE